MEARDFLTETLKLNSGHEIPKEGYGTWLTPEDKVANVVEEAIEVGYRLIDTAHDYNNETGVGQGLHAGMKKARLKREDVFVTTKVDANVLTKNGAAASIRESLEKLELEYVDLVLIHAPRPWKYMDKAPGPNDDHFYDKNKAVWQAFEDAVRAGETHSIGLSQFSVDDMNHLMEGATIKPTLLQTEAYAGNLPRDLMKYCRDNDIQLQAFCPLGHGLILKNAELQRVAARYNVSVPQLCLRYLLQEGFSVIPKTMNVEHMRENTELGFTISEADMDAIDRIDLSHALDGL